jgi:energy-converting hydrogenase A subunit M
MSGGNYDYNQYRIRDIHEQMYKDIIWYSDHYSNITIDKIIGIYNHMLMAEIEVQRMDWLFSGDDGEDTFHKRLEEDIHKVQANILSAPIVRQRQIDYYDNLIQQLIRVLEKGGEHIEELMLWNLSYSKPEWVHHDVEKARRVVKEDFENKSISLSDLRDLLGLLNRGVLYPGHDLDD